MSLRTMVVEWKEWKEEFMYLGQILANWPHSSAGSHSWKPIRVSPHS